MTVVPAPATRVLRGAAALEGLDVLDVLAEQGADLPLPARPVWLRLAARGGEPVLHVLERSGVPVAAAALAVDRRRGVTTVTMLGQGACDSARLPALDPDAAHALVTAVLGELRASSRWRLDLAQLPPDDLAVQQLAARTGAVTSPGVGCPLAEVDHERPLLDQLSRNGRKSVNRSRNRVTTDGHVLSSSWLEGEALLAELPALQQLRRVRDHVLGRASELDTREGQERHTALVRLHGNRSGALVLRLDGELAAYTLATRDGDLLRVWDGRVATGHERLGLGWIADVDLLVHVHADRSLRGVDWMRGEQENKMRSATSVVAAVDLTAFSSPAVARWCALQERTVAAVADAARRVVPPSSRAAVRKRLAR